MGWGMIDIDISPYLGGGMKIDTMINPEAVQRPHASNPCPHPLPCFFRSATNIVERSGETAGH